MKGLTYVERVLETLAPFDCGLTAKDIESLCPGGNPNAIYAALARLANSGAVKKSRTKPVTYVPTGKPFVLSERHLKNSLPTAVGMNAQIEELSAKVRELEAWKAAAIARFPDLGVAPSVLDARRRIAAYFRISGDNSTADKVTAGRMDTTPIVRVMIEAIEELGA